VVVVSDSSCLFLFCCYQTIDAFVVLYCILETRFSELCSTGRALSARLVDSNFLFSSKALHSTVQHHPARCFSFSAAALISNCSRLQFPGRFSNQTSLSSLFLFYCIVLCAAFFILRSFIFLFCFAYSFGRKGRKEGKRTKGSHCTNREK